MPMMMMAQEGEKYPLHRCIFQGDVKTLNTLIRTHDITGKDKQGNLLLTLKWIPDSDGWCLCCCWYMLFAIVI